MKRLLLITGIVATIALMLLLMAGCSPGKHSGLITIHDPNRVEVTFDVPMSMSIERDGVKVEASSLKGSFFEDLLKFVLLRPR